jgi:hypothetical protein
MATTDKKWYKQDMNTNRISFVRQSADFDSLSKRSFVETVKCAATGTCMQMNSMQV